MLSTIGARKKTLEGHSGRVYSGAFSPDGKFLASGSDDGIVQLWDVTNGAWKLIFEGHNYEVHAVVLSPDGKFLASASFDDSLRLCDASTGACWRVTISSWL